MIHLSKMVLLTAFNCTAFYPMHLYLHFPPPPLYSRTAKSYWYAVCQARWSAARSKHVQLGFNNPLTNPPPNSRWHAMPGSSAMGGCNSISVTQHLGAWSVGMYGLVLVCLYKCMYLSLTCFYLLMCFRESNTKIILFHLLWPYLSAVVQYGVPFTNQSPHCTASVWPKYSLWDVYITYTFCLSMFLSHLFSALIQAKKSCFMSRSRPYYWWLRDTSGQFI